MTLFHPVLWTEASATGGEVQSVSFFFIPGGHLVSTACTAVEPVGPVEKSASIPVLSPLLRAWQAVSLEGARCAVLAIASSIFVR